MTVIKKETNEIESEQWFYLSMQEITYSLGIDSATIVEIVEEGIVAPEKNEQNEWQFNTEAFRRIRTIVKLNKDLGVNMAGACLAIELLNEIERLKMLVNR